MQKDFSKNVIKEYTYWTVQVHENQSYLGRCIIACKREDALHLTDATPEEWSELQTILKELKAASEKGFQPDWFNFAFLGNEWRHLHGHLVPRYASARTFMGMNFEDKRFGTNFQTDPTFTTPEEIIQSVKQRMIEALSP